MNQSFTYPNLIKSTSASKRDTPEKGELLRIIKGCLDKDRKHQKQLYEKYYNLIFSVCLRYSKNKDEAKSFVNLSFFKIFEKLGKYENRGTFEGWICRLSINTCLDQIRKKVNYQKHHQSIEETPQVSTPDNIIDQLALQDIYKIIQELPDTHRTVFSLHIIDGYKHAEIAESLKISIGTSRWYLSKAKELLKKKLENLLK